MNKSLTFTFTIALIVILVIVYMQQQQINQLKSSLSYTDKGVNNPNDFKLEKKSIERKPVGFKIPNKKSENKKGNIEDKESK